MSKSLKELVDSYLSKNIDSILSAKKIPGFTWRSVAEKIANANDIDVPDSEYIRSRFRIIMSTSSTIQNNFSYSEKRDGEGNVSIVEVVDRKLTDDEIYERYGRDKKFWKIVTVWFKDNSKGFLLSVNFAPKQEVKRNEDFKKSFTEFIDNYNVKKLNHSQYNVLSGPSLTKENSVLLNLSDLHVGKLAWSKEVGADYSVDIAHEIFMESLKSLAYQAIKCYGVEEFVLNIGGDFLHTNGSLNQTASGTNMNDVDTRYQKIYTKGLEILTDAIDFLISLNARVIVPIVQGNHDKATSFYLGESLKAFYRKDKKVEIINDPHIRKYHKYGVSSYMLTHGDCKEDGLALTFATESPQIFANSEYRYIFLGHLHKASRKVFLTENEVNGVVLRRLNSLSVTDAWHNENNFVGARRMANALVFNTSKGLVAEFNHVIKQ